MYFLHCRFLGPLASTLIKHYGLRVAMFCGGCTAAFGIVVSSFATNIYTIIISFGIVTGTVSVRDHVKRAYNKDHGH